MTKYSGKTVCGGIAIGKIHLVEKRKPSILKYNTEDCAGELRRFEAARRKAGSQIATLYEKAVLEAGETGAAVFEIHQMMLEDDNYLNAVRNIILEQRVNAEYAVSAAADSLAQMFASMEDAYMRERAADVRDISDRVAGILGGMDGEAVHPDEPIIVLAEDLAPSQTVQMDKDCVLSFVTVQGSANSHTAILARTMNIPALVGVDIVLSEDLEGKMAAVDGYGGMLYIEPDEAILSKMQKMRDAELEKKRLLQELRGMENITKDGRTVQVHANIGDVDDLASVLENDAGGIGLFRSEFIYLESSDFPTEEAQFQIYKKIAEAMEGKRVIIRTLDIGADKQADYFGLDREENPAMGLRAIRVCLTRPEIFRTQLRAIYRASEYGRIAVMYPMITSLAEVRRIKEISEQVRTELDRDGIPYQQVEEGIMIETPAAVMISDMLAKEVDFFSIGTNDLSQYAMAIDRQNPKLDAFFDPYHEGVLRMIEMVCKNAHAQNIWVGICGELGADPELTERFLRMGVDELSVSPSSVLPLRNRIRELDLGG